MINKDNLIVVTTTLSNNKISELRRNNLVNNFSKYNTKILFEHGILDESKSYNNGFNILLNRFISFKNSNYEYGLICDDDFFPIDNFIEELNNTTNILPHDWEALHLSPGFLWGRKYRDTSKIGKLNPEYTLDYFMYSSSGRYFANCDPNIYYSLNCWLGGPIAMLVNKKNIDNIINRYTKIGPHHPNDVILTLMLNYNTFICREPQLGYENECGGTTYTP
jgi:hypothetical protein